MKKALHKDFFMEIKKSYSRFLSIFFIVALGVAFFSGIQAASPDMRYSGDAYFDDNRLMDIKVVSTLGLSDNDLKALEKVDGVQYVEGAYGTDVLCGEGGAQKVLHVESLNEKVNTVTVEEGRLPQKEGECLLDSEFLESAGYEIGDTVTFSENDTELLKVHKYEIVGSGNSPLYISFSRGNTTLGSGEVDGFVYVSKENFDQDAYTQAYLQVEGSRELTSFTDEYNELIEQVAKKVEGIEKQQCQLRYDEVKTEANQELTDARKELENKEREVQEELQDAWQQLEDGRQELSDGKAEYEDGKRQLEDAKKQVTDGKAQLSDGKKELEDGKKQLSDGKQQLASGWSQVADGWEQVTASRKELQEGKEELEASQKKLDEEIKKADLDGKWKEYKQQKEAFDTQKKQYERGVQTVQNSLNEVKKAQEQLTVLQAQYDQLKQAVDGGTLEGEELENAKAQLEQLKVSIDQLQTVVAAKPQLEAKLTELEKQKPALDAAEAQLADGKKQLEDAQAQLDAAQEKIDAGKKELEQGEAQIEEAVQKLLSTQQTLKASQSQISDSERQLEDGQREIDENEQKLKEAQEEIDENEQKLIEAEQDLKDGESELADGEKEYEDGKKEADEKIADAKRKLKDAEQEVADLEVPQWYVTDRSDLPEYTDYGDNADRIRNIGKVFPVLFFLVAALISLTTMTRMVEEQRVQIGTMKALGYGKLDIASKYLSYAFLATIGGCVLGVLVGEKFLPYIIIKAYGIMYHHMATDLQIHYELTFTMIASLAAMICTMGATFSACYKELAETPASLMRPPAPKEGKRVLLERVTFLWKRLNFSWKSSVRNLFRYKKRFFMTVFGISGSMALLLVGFGLRDSITDIARLQYEQLQHFDATVIMDEDASGKERQDVDVFIEENGEIKRATKVLFKQVTTRENHANLSVYLYVPENMEEFQQDVTFQDRKTKEQYTMDDNGAIVSEKTASLVGVKEGDVIVLEEDNQKYEVPVSHICENYLSHYIYLSPKLYRETFKEEPQFHDILLTFHTEDESEEAKIGQQILEYPGALSISYNRNIQEQLNNMLSALDMVMIVLIVSAGLLAFVVLYNLNNINITERQRELATIKVLGFYDGEVSAYVFRENILLTVIGVAVGGILGIFLHRFVITTVEVDACMFGRNISALSFIFSGLITCGFSAFVNGVMHFKLKKIDMVESLKSVE
ncbi:FtsX-like permease family protein [Blautia hydrogenotrophica]|uniref:Uncharacterized protein n=1 Tax=Blautia hydrogenotrophica (strain DSM 10507 / JCM 14656 / S5a33) TaxID=476272 RepID=C0CPE0_BLAHS|nr:FtsX-like permease family protein [Blautia hydrogenotrophica]EEG48378.1 efflux ABC transporter, permease protein [Blautia hydrogenotrophica DSM 10507]MCT6797399.1 FtsX-like permease family protein [Blautia hydrogenotrophica]WPX84642.1 Chromosome partition protein Smc [Blautia hydrogenotrophica DSM 10507]